MAEEPNIYEHEFKLEWCQFGSRTPNEAGSALPHQLRGPEYVTLLNRVSSSSSVKWGEY